MSVAADGQPFISALGNNTLEYWSVDSNGVTELPHNLLTGIRSKAGANFQTSNSQTSQNTLASSGDASVDISVGIVALAVTLMKRRRKSK